MDLDLVIRGGVVVDGTGAPARQADVAVAGGRIVAVEESIDGPAKRVIDAGGRIVTPGFVDIHTHLDAQLSWDPIGSSSCWHGVTSVVLGNCGVTFAPCRPSDRDYLAELMESVEDIPREAIMAGLPWDWETYGDFLRSLASHPHGPNVGGMIGHCAVRQYVMGERALSKTPATADDRRAMAALVDEAMAAGALGFSTSRTLLHRVPSGEPVPGTWADPEELYAFADVLARHGKGVFESASRLGEGDDDDLTATRAELAWMGEVARRSGRPVSFGLAHTFRRPELFRRVIEFAKQENELGGLLRPQTTARGVGILFGIETRTPFDRSPAWRELRTVRNGGKLLALRDQTRRCQLIAEAEENPSIIPLDQIWVLPRTARHATTASRRTPSRPTPSVAASPRQRPTSSCCSRPTVSWCATTRSSTRTSPRSKRCSTIRW